MKETKIEQKSIETAKEYKLNINYIEFVRTLKSRKIEVTPENKATVVSLYDKMVGLRFTNLPRVAKRTQRKELRAKLNEKLKELKASEFEAYNEQLIAISTKKSENYAVA